MITKHQNKIILVIFILALLFGVIAIGIGQYSIPISDTVSALLSGGSSLTDETQRTVIFDIRLPRVVLAILAGAGLACAGAAFQSLFSNPLATPDTLGVATGASFGAVLALLFNVNTMLVQLSAVIFGIISVILVYVISDSKTDRSIVMIVLAGMVISSFFQALISITKMVADPQDQLPAITFWLMGSLTGTTVKGVTAGAPLILLGILIIYLLRWRLNAISLNEDEAKSLGINLALTRGLVIAAATMITASVVSLCGQIGWVGLLVPHISRMLFGNDNRLVIPASVSIGALFFLVIDTIARAATASEIPVSILTALIGAPFFIFLLRRTGGIK